MDGNKTVTATFTQIMHTLTVAQVGSGTVTPAVGGHDYPESTVVVLTAAPAAGWSFSGWTGADASGNTVTMDSDKTITATFAIDTFVVRNLPAAVVENTVFEVTIQFTAPDGGFNSIGVTDIAPDGWPVTVNTTWCTPNGPSDVILGNTPDIDTAQYAWLGTYPAGTVFSVVYKVTVPAGTTPGTYTFPDGQIEYYIGDGEDSFISPIGGDNELGWGSTISGIIAQVNGTPIPGATVKLYLGATLKSTTTSGLDGKYELVATETGAYTVVASAVGFKDETQGISIPSLVGGYTLDFIGIHGLIPQDPSMSYVLACANKWINPPAEIPS